MQWRDDAQITEVWVPVPHSNGLYEVSSHGRVRSLCGGKVRLLKVTPHSGSGRLPYLSVPIFFEGRRKRVTVHRIVALAFLGERPAGFEIRHIDGDPGNNCVNNLRYGTARENAADRRRHGNDHQLLKTHCPRGHLYDEVNTYRRPNGKGRVCRACHRIRTTAYHRRVRGPLKRKCAA